MNDCGIGGRHMDERERVNEELEQMAKREWVWFLILTMPPGSHRLDARDSVRQWLNYMDKTLNEGSHWAIYFVQDDRERGVRALVFLEGTPAFNVSFWLWYWRQLNGSKAWSRDLRPGNPTGLFMYLVWKSGCDFGIWCGYEMSFYLHVEN